MEADRVSGRTVGLAAIGAVTLGSAVTAALTIWVLVAEPMALASAVANHNTVPLLQAIVGALGDFLRGLARSL